MQAENLPDDFGLDTKHRQEHSYAILRIAKKMGNAAKSADVSRRRDTEKIENQIVRN